MVKTSVIRARDYGIFIPSTTGEKVFVSPTKYALATLLLESEEQVRDRLKEKANRDGVNETQLIESFYHGVERKSGSHDIIQRSARTAITDVKNQAGSIRGVVHNGHDKMYDVKLTLERSIDDFTIRDARCACPDNRESDIKRIIGMCKHLSALHTGLSYDRKSRAGADRNITGLVPSERLDEGAIPFFADTRANGYRLLTDVLVDIFVEKKLDRDINQEVLNNISVYSNPMIEAITDGHNPTRFGVVRQNSFASTTKNEEMHRSINPLVGRIVRELENRGFSREKSYSLEFKGTPFQTVGVRYRNQSEVQTICTWLDRPPVVVRRYLQGNVDNWINSNDVRTDLPYTRGTYPDVDDTTRRASMTTVLTPKSLASQKIKNLYDKIIS